MKILKNITKQNNKQLSLRKLKKLKRNLVNRKVNYWNMHNLIINLHKLMLNNVILSKIYQFKAIKIQNLKALIL